MIFALISLLFDGFLNRRISPVSAHSARPVIYRKPKQIAKRHPHAKPAWVVQHILRLKILMPKGTGVRKIAATFNRSQAAQKRDAMVKVSKTYVAKILQDNQLAIRAVKKDMRQNMPGISRINRVWGIDLTGKIDLKNKPHFIFGIIDHGSRKLLSLIVSRKHSQLLSKHLLRTIKQYGQPRSIRTDNERCFTSPAFSQHLHSRGIRHQRIAMHCPWQNGRIERLFGTLKQQLNQIHIQNAEHLQTLLDEFKHWYNTIRLHQHLGYQTPQEIWQQQKLQHSKRLNKNPQTEPTWWTGWSGQLSGVQWQC